MTTFSPTPISYGTPGVLSPTGPTVGTGLFYKFQLEANDFSPEVITQFPHLLHDAELMCLRPLDLLQSRVYAKSNFGADAVAYNNARFAGPLDAIEIRWLAYFTPGGTDASTGTRVQLEKRNEEFLFDYWPTGSSTGKPKYYAQLSYPNILVAPTPDLPYNLEIGYINRPLPSLGSVQVKAADGITVIQDTTSFLSTWMPDLLFYAVMVRYHSMIRNTDGVTIYEARFQNELKFANLEELRKKSEDYADQGPSQPPAQKA